METKYLNTDLDVVSQQDLSALAKYFDAHANLLCCEQCEDGKWLMIVEAEGSGLEDSNANRDIGELLNAIEQMDDQLREIWLACEKREFNIGIDTGTTWAYGVSVTSDNLRRMNVLNISLGFTTYPAEGQRDRC